MSAAEADRQLRDAAKALQRLERVRTKVFHQHGTLFRDPAWSMMLAAFVADHAGEVLLTKGLVAASGVPATTALRHIESLEAAGLIERTEHDRDRRSSIVAISDAGRALMEETMSRTTPRGDNATTSPMDR